MLRAGESAGFKAGDRNGHHLQNRSTQDAVVREIGARNEAVDEAYYPDIDLHALKGRAGYARKDRSPYLGAKPRNPASDK